MRICFVDFAPWDYNVATPVVRPLGGSQSALCYLAVALANLGHDVTTVTQTRQPGPVCGVACLTIAEASGHDFDAVVCLNAPGHLGTCRHLWPNARLVLWAQLASNQIAMRKLDDPANRDGWADIVCVSDWHAREMIERFPVEPSRVTVLRNAIAPAFAGMFSSETDLKAAKAGSPRLAYTSTPYRGLQFFASIFPVYRAVNPAATLDVYSSMAVYMESAEKDRSQFAPIYDALSAVEGVRLHGSLPQPELAAHMRLANIWAYPNAFPETSCIAAMEAMASGLRVVTSDLGALPETCESFAHLVPIEVEIDDANARIAVKGGDDYSNAFTRALLGTAIDAAALYAQVVHMNRHHTWSARSRQWSDFLAA